MWARHSGHHPLIDYSAPEFVWADGRTLIEQLRDRRGLLLDFTPNALLRALAEGQPDRLTCISTNTTDCFGLTAVLIRPDGFIAWATDSTSDLEQARRAIAHWFGETSSSTSSTENSTDESRFN